MRPLSDRRFEKRPFFNAFFGISSYPQVSNGEYGPDWERHQDVRQGLYVQWLPYGVSQHIGELAGLVQQSGAEALLDVLGHVICG